MEIHVQEKKQRELAIVSNESYKLYINYVMAGLYVEFSLRSSEMVSVCSSS